MTASEHIIIFFTQNARKIDMAEIANHGAAELKMIEIPAGKQSADIHIGSYLGYLAGKSKCNIVIISDEGIILLYSLFDTKFQIHSFAH